MARPYTNSNKHQTLSMKFCYFDPGHHLIKRDGEDAFTDTAKRVSASELSGSFLMVIAVVIF
ncbi:unnamed protein product [Clonostachys rosea]|uniref:Uncharacterized protein n=1 Tax=Bionectria ochroleuca TaxID=29856 RepID=A0ABY6UR62_BIOOC|nr:unnamed protein product [Clonostachys rosea]